MKFRQFSSIEKVLSKNPLPEATFNDSMAETYSLYCSGIPVQKIATQRRVQFFTIADQLRRCIIVGKPVKLEDITVTNDVMNIIVNVIQSSLINSDMTALKSIKLSCPDAITYHQIQTVITYLQICDHLAKLNCDHEDFKNALVGSYECKNSDKESEKMIEALNALIDEIAVDEFFMNSPKVNGIQKTENLNTTAVDCNKLKESNTLFEDTKDKRKKKKKKNENVNATAVNRNKLGEIDTFFEKKEDESLMGPPKVKKRKKEKKSENVNVDKLFKKKCIEEPNRQPKRKQIHRNHIVLHYFERRNLLNKKIQKDCRGKSCTKMCQTMPEKYVNEEGLCLYDVTEDSLTFLTAVITMGGYSITTHSLFLLGSKNSQMKVGHKMHIFYGIGKHESAEWWTCLGQILLRENYLESQGQDIKDCTDSVVYISRKGRNFLKFVVKNPMTAKLVIEPTEAMLKLIDQKMELLLSSGCVLPEKIKDAKIEEKDLSKSSLPGVQLTRSIRLSYALYNAGFPLKRIATHKHLSHSLIVCDLCECMKAGKPVKLTDLEVTKYIKNIIVDVIRSPPINSDMTELKEIKDRCPESITCDQIRVVIAYLQVQDHLNQMKSQ